MEHDNICRFIFEDIPVRGEIVRLQESYQTAITNHHYPTDVGKLLGEALAAVTLLCETMKFEGPELGIGLGLPRFLKSRWKFNVRRHYWKFDK